VQDRVTEPEPPVIVDELRLQDSPVLGDRDKARVTLPVKPPDGVTVIVDVAVCVFRIGALVGLAVREKSPCGPGVIW
jgi:hypothetical protein